MADIKYIRDIAEIKATIREKVIELGNVYATIGIEESPNKITLEDVEPVVSKALAKQVIRPDKPEAVFKLYVESSDFGYAPVLEIRSDRGIIDPE